MSESSRPDPDLDSIIASAYDPAFARDAGHALVDEIHRHLVRAIAEPTPVFPWKRPHDRVLDAKAALRAPTRPTAESVARLARQFLDNSNRLHSPRYMGHQVPPPIPVAGLFELLGSVINQPSGIYEMGPFSIAAETALAETLVPYLGWTHQGWGSVVTHGGSLANLTALLAARSHRYPDAWSRGVSALPARPAILTSRDSHYSISRAAAIAGFGEEQVLKLDLDSSRRLDPSHIDRVVAEARARGLDPFMLVGSSCSTPIGAFDPLDRLADAAKRHGLWFHVDAAHGAGLLLSRKHRDLLRGIEHADSVTWDAHKMMFVPALCTFVFYRDRLQSYGAFHQDAPYLFDDENSPVSIMPAADSTTEFDVSLRTLECTKRPLAIGLWAAWAAFGPDLFEKLVDRTVGLAREFHELLGAQKDFESPHAPECNILCFRYQPSDDRGQPIRLPADFQARLRKRLIRSGDFYITGTVLDGQSYLRVVFMNARTARPELLALLDSVRLHGQALLT